MFYELFKPCRLTHATWTCFKETALLFNVQSKNAGHHGWLVTNKNLAHALKQSPKTKFGQNFKWFKISYLEFFFWKYYFEHTKFLYSSTRSSGHYQSFYLILRFSNRKSQSQQKLAKNIHAFYNAVSLKKPLNLRI